MTLTGNICQTLPLTNSTVLPRNWAATSRVWYASVASVPKKPFSRRNRVSWSEGLAQIRSPRHGHAIWAIVS